MPDWPVDMRDDDLIEYDETNDPKGIRRGSLLHMAREWILLQLGRVCSDKVSNDYFDFAWKYAEVFAAFKRAKNGRTVQLKDLRRKIYAEHLPNVKMDFIYEDLSLPKEDREGSVSMNTTDRPCH